VRRSILGHPANDRAGERAPFAPRPASRPDAAPGQVESESSNARTSAAVLEVSMNIEVVLLRWLHIIPAVLWVGGTVFMVFIVEPSVRRLGPAVQGPVMSALGRMSAVVFATSGVLTLVVGLSLVARTPGRGFGDLFANGWGWMMGVGLLATVAALTVGFMTGTTMRTIAALPPGEAGAPPPPEVLRAAGQMRTLGRVTVALLLVALATMGAARFV
jgi:uncharacterized membrane protein